MPDISLLSVGGAACALSGVLWWKERKAVREHEDWCATAARAEGTVSRAGLRDHLSRNEPRPDDYGGYGVAVVRFRAANGVEYEFDAPGAPQTAGAHVEVAYDPALPSSARTVQRVPKVGCIAAILVIGVALIAAGLLR